MAGTSSTAEVPLPSALRRFALIRHGVRVVPPLHRCEISVPSLFIRLYNNNKRNDLAGCFLSICSTLTLPCKEHSSSVWIGLRKCYGLAQCIAACGTVVPNTGITANNFVRRRPSLGDFSSFGRFRRYLFLRLAASEVPPAGQLSTPR